MGDDTMSKIKAQVVENTTGGATTLTDLYPCKAWANFNGTGTVYIFSSGNVSSLTDNSTGKFTLNLSASTSTTHQSVSGSAQGASGVSYDGAPVGRNTSISKSTSSVAIYAARLIGTSTCGISFDSADTAVMVVA
jgi:hypothetical protein